MRGCRLSPAARQDIEDIWTYTVRTWGAAQAERYLVAIRDACQALTDGRRQGRAIDDIRPGYRKLPVRSHARRPARGNATLPGGPAARHFRCRPGRRRGGRAAGFRRHLPARHLIRAWQPAPLAGGSAPAGRHPHG
ncbi:MAG: type II toxin-antitoxin system RelE/ParE family toxin [Acetobacteraceae bacterium]|nr:type II toxin-antitoxin system RelE/ParE family toxin [Acetobacteraceae bacterium]